MEFFPALGLAVLGIFVTIILSGVLAGIIAFGLIESNSRGAIQARVIRILVDRRIEDFFTEDGRSVFRDDDGREESLSYVRNRGFESLVPLDPRRLFRLPYRQLCGQLANAIGAESFGADEKGDGRSNFQPLTLALFIANLEGAKRRRAVIGDGRISDAVLKTHALAFLDELQIALADAVLERARILSMIVIAIIFMAILAPNLDRLNIYGTDPSFILRSTGTLIALIIAPIMILLLGSAASIVAALIFRWIDRFAAAR
jgi:hypothetical protein